MNGNCVIFVKIDSNVALCKESLVSPRRKIIGTLPEKNRKYEVTARFPT